MAKVLTKTLRTAAGLCLRIKGNLGAATFRTVNKEIQIAYIERRRTTALTDKQLAHRVRFLRAYEQWNTLSQEEKDDWTLAANRTSSRQIGSHLFLRVWWRQDLATIDQVLRHFNITLTLPGP